MRFDWESASNTILINPRFPEKEKEFLLEMLQKSPPLVGHIWIATSGSTAESAAQFKWVALSKKAILASAESVNRHINSNKSDSWLNPLPFFHAGGMGINARAHLSGAKVVNFLEKWDPVAFHQFLTESKITLTSLVPTQIYDLVREQLESPPALRAIFIGGGKLSDHLYQKATELGWKLLPSYGLTECASQVATASLEPHPSSIVPKLKILPHVELKTDQDNHIMIKSPALLSLYAFWQESGPKFVDPKVDGWFKTEDKGEFNGGYLTVYGRASNFVKIGGESVDLSRLEKILEEIKIEQGIHHDIVIIAVPDERLGHAINLCAAASSQEEIQEVIDTFQNRVLPYEKIRKVHIFGSLPRTPIYKLQSAKLLRMIQERNR